MVVKYFVLEKIKGKKYIYKKTQMSLSEKLYIGNFQ